MKTSNTIGRRGFTLIEMMVACVITAFIMGSVAMSLGQLSRAKTTCKERLDAHLRADVAVAALRRDIVTIIRTDDLFWTRLLLIDDTVATDAKTTIGAAGIGFCVTVVVTIIASFSVCGDAVSASGNGAVAVAAVAVGGVAVLTVFAGILDAVAANRYVCFVEGETVISGGN